MKIAIGNDHVAIDLKNVIKNHLEAKGYEVIDCGTNETASTDYPIYAQKVVEQVNGTCDYGILICGTGVGMSIYANKHQGIRALVCSEPYSAKLSKEHNDSNVLCFGARVIGSEMAKMIVDNWLEAEYQGTRHQKRVDMINAKDKYES